MKKELSVLAVLFAVAAVSAAEINLTRISESVDFFGAKGGIVENPRGDEMRLVFYGFVGGGFLAILILIVFVAIIFYKYKYSSKEGGAISEQDLFKKYNY
jgi:hypothetical protein